MLKPLPDPSLPWGNSDSGRPMPPFAEYMQQLDRHARQSLPLGTTTNDDAAAGYVGEYLSVVSGGGTLLTNNVTADVITLALTAGDWDVRGTVLFAGNPTTSILYLEYWLNSASVTLAPVPYLCIDYRGGIVPFGVALYLTVYAPPRRFSLAAPTTIYLSVNAGFTVDILGVAGAIQARRMR